MLAEIYIAIALAFTSSALFSPVSNFLKAKLHHEDGATGYVDPDYTYYYRQKGVGHYYKFNILSEARSDFTCDEMPSMKFIDNRKILNLYYGIYDKSFSDHQGLAPPLDSKFTLCGVEVATSYLTPEAQNKIIRGISDIANNNLVDANFITVSIFLYSKTEGDGKLVNALVFSNTSSSEFNSAYNSYSFNTSTPRSLWFTCADKKECEESLAYLSSTKFISRFFFDQYRPWLTINPDATLALGVRNDHK